MIKLIGKRTATIQWTNRLGALAAAAVLVAGCGSSGTPSHDGGGGRGPDGSAGGGGGGSDGGASDGGGDGVAMVCPTAGSGQLKVAVAGLADGATPMIRVVGPGLTPMVLTIGTPVTLNGGGGYEIEYRRYKTAPAAGSVVGKAYFISANDFTGCIKNGETTTATLTYTQEPGSEKMWVSVSNAMTLGNVIAGFDGTAVATSGAKVPSVWKQKNFTGRAAAGAFDFDGNFWVPGGNRINMYPMPTLATTSDAAPDIKLDQPATASASFAAFDSSGNLWISRGTPGTESSVVRYAAAQLAASGAPTPSVVLTSADMMNPAGIAFDTSGDLWVASQGNDKVLKFNAGHLGASSTGAADLVITTKTAATAPVANVPYTEPVGLAFDKDGNLWVGYIANVVKLTLAQQGASAAIAGPFAINLATGTGGFAFDESGGLWCPGPGVGAGNHQFQRIPAAALGTAGDVTPDILIDSAALGGAETIVLNPAPTWSPIHDWL